MTTIHVTILAILIGCGGPIVCDKDGDGEPGPWCDGQDCDDIDPDNAPGFPEVCDGEDNDCDGEANADPAGEVDIDGDGSLSCEDCNDERDLIYPGAPELCDGLDDDCDGVLPEDEQDDNGNGIPNCADP